MESVPAPPGRYAHPHAPPEQSQYRVVDAVRVPGVGAVGAGRGTEEIGGDVVGSTVGVGALLQIISA